LPNAMLEVKVREFRHSDYDSYAAIHNALNPTHPLFLERAKYEDSCFERTRYRMKRYVAESDRGEMVGVGGFEHLFFSYHPHRLALSVEVHPTWQRRGIGGLLYERLESELRSAGAEAAWAIVESTHSESVAFVRKRGFAEKRRFLESTLDLTSFDPAKFEPRAKELESKGIVFASLAEEMSRDPTSGRKLYELENSADRDVPNIVKPNPMSYHDYNIIILKSPVMLWEGSFVAKKDYLYVGSSSVIKSGLKDTIEQGFTAVRPGFRRRGLAQAVKLMVAKHTRSHGVKSILTHNDSQNEAILTVNEKLGFVRRSERIEFEKVLQD